MKKPIAVPFATNAICAIADIKAAVEAFDRGETNVLDALDTIVAAIEEYRAVLSDRPKRLRPPRKAA